MPFECLRFQGFRNLANGETPVKKRQVFFIGPNGQGKTNFLEAVYLSCYGRSFRTLVDQELIQFGSNSMSVMARYIDPQDVNNISTIQVKIENRKKTIFIDGKAINDRKDLISRYPCIVFCHDDIEFVKGSPEFQRMFFDQSASLISLKYLADLQAYTKTLKTRNLLIKQESWDLLPVYDEQLAIFGMELVKQRREMIRSFNSVFTVLHGAISGITDTVQIEYRSSWEKLELHQVLDRLKERRTLDQKMKTTTSGPHRDRYLFMKGEMDFMTSASTGQIRLMSLLLRLSQAHLLYRKISKPVILLIDDVLLELDPKKRKLFMDNIPEFDQIFYTFLPGETMAETEGDDILKFQVIDGAFHEESR